MTVGQTTVYVGGNGGIDLLSLDPETGALVNTGMVAELTAPSFLALHPGGNLLYCTNNDGAGKGSSHAVCFYRVPDSGDLIHLNQIATLSTTSVYFDMDSKGRVGFVANYWGSIAVFHMEPDGRLGKVTQLVQHEGSSVALPRQSSALPHCVRVSPDDKFVYVPDLGTDEVVIYELDPEKALLKMSAQGRAKIQEGSGPRHLDFHPTEPIAYLINELSSTITVFDREEETGGLIAKQTVSTLPAGFTSKNLTAQIKVHPSGKFVYGSNRGHNSIAAFAVVAGTGVLKPVEIQPSGGEYPWDFAIDPSGKWMVVANEGSNSCTVFSIDPLTGELTQVGDPVKCAAPRCVLFVP